MSQTHVRGRRSWMQRLRRRGNASGSPVGWQTEGASRRRRRTAAEVRRRRIRLWVTAVVLLFLNVYLVNVVFEPKQEFRPRVPYNVFDRELLRDNVAEVTTTGFTVLGTLRRSIVTRVDGVATTHTIFVTERPPFAKDDLLRRLLVQKVTVNASSPGPPRSLFASFVLSVVPIVILVGLYFLLIRGIAGRTGIGMGRSRARLYEPEQVQRVTFADVAGIDEVKDELTELVDILRDPARYRRLGAVIPKGVLLSGAPGTGKTLLARAVAGEANVPFFSASASEFVEMIVGVGASRVRDLFTDACKVAPAIVFIDEIDAIGRARGGTRMGATDEREQTLNQILTEMDGFTGREGVIVLGATNRPDVLDPALLRPGRFDRRVIVNAPDQRGREEILAVHARDTPLADDVDLHAIAATTPGMVGADLANLINEAALLAARRRHDAVTRRDFNDALEKVVLGAARHIVIPEDERVRTAYHEAGHAILGMVVRHADPVRKVSIIPRGQALGVTFQSPEEDRYAYTVKQLEARIISALGGRAAEEIVLEEISTGAESDLEFVSQLARMMVGRWGMSPAIGPLAALPRPGSGLSGDGDLASDELRSRVDSEVRRIVEGCYAMALRLLRERRDRLESLAQALLEHETLDADDAYRAAGIDPPRKPVPAGVSTPPDAQSSP